MSDLELRVDWLERELARLSELLEKLQDLNGQNQQNAMLRGGVPNASS
jgi:hypothetical protein